MRFRRTARHRDAAPCEGPTALAVIQPTEPDHSGVVVLLPGGRCLAEAFRLARHPPVALTPTSGHSAATATSRGTGLSAQYFGRFNPAHPNRRWVFGAQDRSAFVCRGDGCTTYENANTVTGFVFGSRRTQRISARLYDKTAEMALKSTDWWELVWGDRHTPGTQVWRIEFEVGRPALSDLELFRPEAVLAALPSLWAYCTGEWLTLRSPSADSNRSRWPVDLRWHAVQAASLAHGRHGAAVHPRAQTGHPPSQPHARPRRVPRRLRRCEGDLRHRRHIRGAPRRRGQRRSRAPHHLRRAGPAPSSRKGVPVSSERHDRTTGTEREGGRRQAPDGEGRPRGRALAGRPSRHSFRSLRCAECGEQCPPSALLTMDQVACRLGTSLRHVRRLVAERRIPIVKVGRFVRFDAHAVEHWVDDHRVAVVPPRDALRASRLGESENRRAG